MSGSSAPSPSTISPCAASAFAALSRLRSSYQPISRSVSSLEMIGALQSRRLRFPRRNEQHVAVAQQRFGAHAVDDRAAVDLRCDAERDPARKVRLDEPGDDVHARPLRRQDQVDADRARLLREHRERRLDLALHRHHEVGQLVDHHHNVRQDAALVVEVLERNVGSLRRLERRPSCTVRLKSWMLRQPFAASSS